MNDFAVFIMVHGRPENMWTLPLLRKSGYTGKIFLVADNLDESLEGYRKRYGKDLLVFDKKEAASKMDSGDNSGDLRSTLYAANTIRDLAKQQGLKYYSIMCDDYTTFYHNFDENNSFDRVSIVNLDAVFKALLDFYKKTPITVLAMAQGGDFVGGSESQNAEPRTIRKAMNTFICDVDRPFEFVGRLNEDVTTYVLAGSRGQIFLTVTNVSIIQKTHQSQKGGLTDVYLDFGTYVKSFFSVMYNPSCVKISELRANNTRVHHKVFWNNAVPKILDPIHRK